MSDEHLRQNRPINDLLIVVSAYKIGEVESILTHKLLYASLFSHHSADFTPKMCADSIQACTYHQV